MRKNKLLLILFAMLLASPAMAAPNVTVTVRAEPVGADIVFHYTLTRSGPEQIGKFSIGTNPAGYGCVPVDGGITVCTGNYTGKLVTMPIGTTWSPDPYFNNLRETPTLSAGATTQPANWKPRASMLKPLGGVGYEGPGTVGWELPFETNYPFPATFTQQPSYDFSIRVPAGPGSTAEYMNGLFSIYYHYQGYAQTYHAPIQPLAAPNTPASIQVPASVQINVGFAVTWAPPAVVPGSSPPAYYKLEESMVPTFSGCKPCPPGRVCAALCTPYTWESYSGPATQYLVSAGRRFAGTSYFRVMACNSAGCSPPRTGTNSLVIR